MICYGNILHPPIRPFLIIIHYITHISRHFIVVTGNSTNIVPYHEHLICNTNILNMELHPFLEKSMSPNMSLWYVMNTDGGASSQWVGPSCTYVPNSDGHNGHVYVTGGTDPSGSFSCVRVLDIDNFSWSQMESIGLQSRYEHSAFVSASKLFVFGGASQEGNHNSIQSLDLGGTVPHTWATLSPGGTAPPSARTYHTMGDTLKDRFVVYSGGRIGSEPVKDKQVHMYDINENQWLRPNVKGTVKSA